MRSTRPLLKLNVSANDCNHALVRLLSDPLEALTSKKRTFNDFATEVVPNLFLGSVGCSGEELLNEFGVVNVVNVTPAPHNYTDAKIKEFQIPIEDCVFDDSFVTIYNENIDSVVLFIDNALRNNEKVLVHCHAGISRSASVVCDYLQRCRQDLVAEHGGAVNFLTSKKPSVEPNFFVEHDTTYRQSPKFGC